MGAPDPRVSRIRQGTRACASGRIRADLLFLSPGPMLEYGSWALTPSFSHRLRHYISVDPIRLPEANQSR
jgi:hypothetical protein